MIQIVKPGDRRKALSVVQSVRFACGNCGCVFTGEPGDFQVQELYGSNNGVGVVEREYYCECPNCGETAPAEAVKTVPIYEL